MAFMALFLFDCAFVERFTSGIGNQANRADATNATNDAVNKRSRGVSGPRRGKQVAGKRVFLGFAGAEGSGRSIIHHTFKIFQVQFLNVSSDAP